MMGGVTRRGLPHLPGIPHLRVSRALLNIKVGGGRGYLLNIKQSCIWVPEGLFTICIIRGTVSLQFIVNSLLLYFKYLNDRENKNKSTQQCTISG